MRTNISAWLTALVLLLCGLAPAAAQPPAFPAASPAGDGAGLDVAFNDLYNLKFGSAHSRFDLWIIEHPGDPLGPASHGSAYLFEELYRLRILQANSLLDGQKLSASSLAGRPNPKVRQALYREMSKAVTQAQVRLARSSSDEEALLALTIAYGTQADYLNLVEKRPWASLPLFKKSNHFAQALLRHNPRAFDALTTSGFTEYLAGSLPFYTRWFVRFEAVKGDKRAGIQQLRLAATHGRFLRPYAKVLLAAVYLREKRPAESVKLLEELRIEFPENTVFAQELNKILVRYPALRASARAARAAAAPSD